MKRIAISGNSRRAQGPQGHATRTLLLAAGFAGLVFVVVHYVGAGPSQWSTEPATAHARDLRTGEGGTSVLSLLQPSTAAGHAGQSTPSMTGSSGHIVDLEGKTVAQYVAQYEGAARLGDAAAAYKVYLAESLCAAGSAARDQGSSSTHVDTAHLCAAVTPADVQERLQFLALAARSGQAGASVDFLIEGPDGTGNIPSAGSDADSADVKRWKDDALSQLEGAAGQCDPLAAGLLATSYGSGKFNAQDPSQAIAFDLLAAAAGNGKWSRERLHAQFGANMQADTFDAAYTEGLQAARRACPQARTP